MNIHDDRGRAPQKRAIARYAGTLCSEGELIAINAGSTTAMMTEFLTGKQLTIITNSFHMAQQLVCLTGNDIVLTAGTVYREQDIVLSPFDDAMRAPGCASKMFTGAFGIAEHGLMEIDPLLIQAKHQLMRLARDLVVLADSHKLARKADLILCALGRVGALVTDTGASDASVQMLERAGVTVVTVEPEQPGSGYH